MKPCVIITIALAVYVAIIVAAYQYGVKAGKGSGEVVLRSSEIERMYDEAPRYWK